MVAGVDAGNNVPGSVKVTTPAAKGPLGSRPTPLHPHCPEGQGEGEDEEDNEGDGEPDLGALQAHRGLRVRVSLLQGHRRPCRAACPPPAGAER